MFINEVKLSIMNVPQGYYLAQAISSDLKFNVGMPALFDQTFNMKEKMLNNLVYWGEIKPGHSYVVDNVFNLVVKESSYDKPKKKKLRKALTDMRDGMKILGVTKVAMPKICCGRNGLSWEEKVKPMIEEVFADEDVEILVCSID